MRFFKKLSRRQRTVKIARVATHEHATRQLKKMQKKVARVKYLVTKSLTLSLAQSPCNFFVTLATQIKDIQPIEFTNDNKARLNYQPSLARSLLQHFVTRICHACSHHRAPATPVCTHSHPEGSPGPLNRRSLSKRTNWSSFSGSGGLEGQATLGTRIALQVLLSCC